MSSQARIAANKRNAVRSTGLLTIAGKMRASRNARKHGLSVSIRHDPGISNKIEVLAVAIAGKNATPRLLKAARGVAEAQLELKRLQEFKLSLIERNATDMYATTKLSSGGDHPGSNEERTMQDNALAYLRALPDLAKLERYEWRAMSRYRKAFHKYAIASEK